MSTNMAKGATMSQFISVSGGKEKRGTECGCETRPQTLSYGSFFFSSPFSFLFF